MRNISILQLIVLIFVAILIFSDFPNIKKKIFDLLKKNKRKGI